MTTVEPKPQAPRGGTPRGSELIRLQREFCALTARLIDKAVELGFHPRWGDAYRDPRVAYGHPGSVHRVRLAVDLLLDSATGEYLTATEAYQQLGEWWEKQHPLARWGGRFKDGNHYSFAWQGVR
jgi:hypothetical protein